MTQTEDGYRTFRFTADLEELAELGSIDALNELLDHHLDQAGFKHFSTDISYRPVEVVPTGGIVVEATYLPSDHEEDEDGPEVAIASGDFECHTCGCDIPEGTEYISTVTKIYCINCGEDA